MLPTTVLNTIQNDNQTKESVMDNDKHQFSPEELKLIIDNINKIVEPPSKSIWRIAKKDHSPSIEEGTKVLLLLQKLETLVLEKFPALLWENFKGLIKVYEYKYARKIDIQQIHAIYNTTVLQTAEDLQTGKFKGDSSIKHYFNTIFHNKTVDEYRKKTTHKEQAFSPIDGVLSNLTEEALSIIGENEAAILGNIDNRTVYNLGLSKLSHRCQKIIQMRFELELTHKQVEEIFKIFQDTGNYNRPMSLECVKKFKEQYLKIDNNN